MSQVVDHLAELTGFRDRDVMDVTLVMALRDLLEPESVAIYRAVGEPGQERWLTRAHLRAGDAVAAADPLWASPESLPPLSAHPLRLDAMRTRAVTQVARNGSWLYLFPLATERDAVSVIEIQSAHPLGAASQRTVSSVLRIYHNFQGLLDYSERDTLTGLLNRKTFDESFLKLVSELPARHAPPISGERRHEASQPHYVLGVIDIDHFKSVNDRFGHLIGDEVLLLLSRLMRGSFRFHDLLYRFGGEEFVVLMRCDGEPHAGEAFERLRLNTERYQFPQVGQITVSIGFTEMRTSDTPAAAFERADKAVYHAKSSGRNQVHNYATLVSRGIIREAEQLSDVELF
ncbi:MAG: GGDEF domain-containing protein [Roseateles depolymerans]|uniref:diguanylate cyclase n=1 Tax=Roseateles depolymerans TaxID=76731 RepID=A0A2W5F590_9BURK|nr:MAG: GGDEF domain-containing protein [Roseateles depolymerans]